MEKKEEEGSLWTWKKKKSINWIMRKLWSSCFMGRRIKIQKLEKGARIGPVHILGRANRN